MNFFKKKGQIGIYVIVALALVAAVAIYFVVKGNQGTSGIPADVAPVFSYYQDCIKNEVEGAVTLAGSQGGRVYVKDYIPGSEYAPSSSQLNFLGFGVPYWYYISGNGIAKEQVPTKAGLENEIAEYIEGRINNCNFDYFYNQGYSLQFASPRASVKLNDNSIDVEVDAMLRATKGSVTGQKSTHEVEVISSLGKLFSLARSIYSYERTSSFLENYTIDVLRLYAPVDGVELGCSPKIWRGNDVIDALQSGLEANIATLKFSGGDYTITDSKRNYFVLPYNVETPTRMVYSKDWASKFEIIGSDGELLIAKPVGTQEGLGVMGFCYAPYHFVYNIQYPVLFQITEGDEVFQFPVIVVIDRNVPKVAAVSGLEEEEASVDICAGSTESVEIKVFDSELGPVDGDVSYVCFDQQCRLGRTNKGVLNAKAPPCYNGFLRVDSEGYAHGKILLSTNSQHSAEVFLEKEYGVRLQLEVGSRPLSGGALVSFVGPSTSSAYLPESNTVDLAEGYYNVSVFVYGNSSIRIPASTKTQCQEVPRSGLMGMFGSTREECYNISLPETTIDNALVGGGMSSVYILGADIKDGLLKLSVPSFSVPSSVEQMQLNFEALSQQRVEVIG